MHADIIQENNLSNLSTVSELGEMKPNLVDKTCKLLKSQVSVQLQKATQ